LWVLGLVGDRIPKIERVPPFEFNTEKAQKLMSLSFIFVGMIAFNNLCLKYVEVSFYQVRCYTTLYLSLQVARALTILFNVAFTYYLLNTTTSWPAIRACLVVVLGFLVGSGGEANFTWLGVIYGVTSSVFVALYSIYVKKGLPIVENNHW
jgi:GDP-fucose transporter C1